MPEDTKVRMVNIDQGQVWDFIKNPDNWPNVLGADSGWLISPQKQQGKPVQVKLEKRALGRPVDVVVSGTVDDSKKSVDFKFDDGILHVSVAPANQANASGLTISYETTKYSVAQLPNDLNSVADNLNTLLTTKLTNRRMT